MRNKSQKSVKTSGNVAVGVSLSTATARKQLKLESSDNSNSDMTENKSGRQQSDGTHSTNTSSKVNSDSIPREPHMQSRQPSQALFRSSPGRKINSRTRIVKKPRKVCALNNNIVMINRWIGFLKNKLPQFDLEDSKSNR